MKVKIKDLFRKAYDKLFRKKAHGIDWGQGFNETSLAQPWVYDLPKRVDRANDATNPQLSQIADTQGMEAIEQFRSLFEAAYPVGSRLLAVVHEFDGGIYPSFMINANIASSGFISAASSCSSFAGDVVLQKVGEVLKERTHTLDISRVVVNGFHQDGNFILNFNFGKIPSVDEKPGD